MDEYTRKLQRLAAAGDREAQIKLGNEYLRHGQLTAPSTPGELKELFKLGYVAIPALQAAIDNINNPVRGDAIYLMGVIKTQDANINEKAAMLIETCIQPYMVKPSDDPHWWIDQIFDQIEMEQQAQQQMLDSGLYQPGEIIPSPLLPNLDVVRTAENALTNYYVFIDRGIRIDGIKTAEKAKLMLRGWHGPIVAWCDACDAPIFEKFEEQCLRGESALCPQCLGLKT